MALTIEWRRRIDNWRKELPKHLYRPLLDIDLSGFVTSEQLTSEEASAREFEPMPVGTIWGAKWEYGWFKGEVTVPDDAVGKRLTVSLALGRQALARDMMIEEVLTNALALGREALVYVNGRLASGRMQFTLAREAVPDERYELLIEVYAGHGPMVCSVGPTPPGRETVPEPPSTQAEVRASTIGIWEEDAYQLHIEVEGLFGLRDASADQNSLRVAEIDQALRDFTTIVDFELPQDEMMETIRECRKRLAPLFACVNGTTAPVIHAFGHGHLDVAWLWPLAETERKVARTLANQLSLIDEYPGYRFMHSQAHLYRIVKERHPELYERVKQAVRDGGIIADGAMWVEADINVTGGESLIRQFMHGIRFFRDELGAESRVMWLPDVFGYSGAMPQIMLGCGVRYFASQKIFWNYNGGETFPHNLFHWEGIDGSRVLAHFFTDYNSEVDPGTVIRRWHERVQKDGLWSRVLAFGHGDGGGGPTRDHLEHLKREKDLEGVPRVLVSSPADYFADIEAAVGAGRARLPVYVGELYLQAHRGTYTSQAKTKRGNRKGEFALREAEMWGAAAMALKGYAYPAGKMDEEWKKVLLNQFHDILPGSSIARVYEEAEASYAEVIETVNGVAQEAASAFVSDANALAVFNSLGWERTALVQLPEGFEGTTDVLGNALPTQEVDGRRLAEVKLPSCGWTTVKPGRAAAVPANKQATDPVCKAAASSIENDFLRVEFNEYGEITSIVDKETRRELASGSCNNFRMYRDITTSWDAWDLDSMYGLTPVELKEKAEIEALASGPLVARLQITRTLNRSEMTQTVELRRGCRRVDFHTVIDWQESHKLLKVSFPVSIHANEAVHEIQFGHIRRPNHLSRQFDADRFEVCNHKWTALVEEGRGCAVLNDCKYGVNVLGNSINLTLLKSALAPDMTADKGRQEFTYAFYTWNGPFMESGLVREGYDLNVPVLTIPGDANEGSLASVREPGAHQSNVVVETVKPAEDGSGDTVVRLYESMGTATRCELRTALPMRSALATTMLEEKEADLEVKDGVVALEFRPFEIKTIRLCPA